MNNMILKESSIDFLKNLAINNNRAWFAENKSAYHHAKTDYEQFINGVIRELNDKLDLGSVNAKECIYRIFKDRRFIRDESPYKAKFGASISSEGKKGTKAAVHMYLTPDGITRVDLGTCRLQPKELAGVRNQINKNPGKLRTFLSSENFQNTFGNEITGKKVKTAPRGYTIDNKNIDLLRFKNYNISTQIKKQDLFNGKFGEKICKIVSEGKEFLDFINNSIKK